MSIFDQLSSLALDFAADLGDNLSDAKAAAGGLGAVAGLVLRRFVDHSQKLNRALERSAARAWRAAEVSLAGQSWWDRCKLTLATADERAVRQQVQAYLQAHPLDGVDGHGPNFRAQCLAQLGSARKAGLLDRGPADPEEVARRVGDLARFGDPAARVQAELRTLDDVAARLRHAGYDALATFLTLRPAGGPPLLMSALRFFFRREVERDSELFQGLAHSRLEGLAEGQQAGFAQLAEALDAHGDRLEALLADVQAVVVQTHASVLDMKAELARQGQQIEELGGAILRALDQRQLAQRELQGGDSLSVRDEDERRLVRDLVRRYRSLPAEQRKRMPALLNAVGKLEVVAGDFDAAQQDFLDLAAIAPDTQARAEAAHNAYRVALERRDWDAALRSLREAVELAPARFAPFPAEKFEAERILGAGGFGVAILCRNRHSGARVVVKTLRRDGLDRDLNEVFREAQALEELDHPAIIRVRDCDYAGNDRSRPFLVMDYFPGQTLAERVEQGGPLSVGEFLPLARTVAEGLSRAHAKGILHRDVKPANLLVRRDGGKWEARLIDFGLALRVKATASTMRASLDRTLMGGSIAGTLEYAAPEQLGKLKGVAVGPTSDVYGFGKLCCFALFGTPQPTFQHWQRLPRDLADLLGRCLDEQPRGRPQAFAEVLRDLDRLMGPAQAPAKPTPRAESGRPTLRPVMEAMPLDALPVLDAEAAPVARVKELPIDHLPEVQPKPPVREPQPLPRPPRFRDRRKEGKDGPQRKGGWKLPVILGLLLVGAGVGAYLLRSLVLSSLFTEQPAQPRLGWQVGGPPVPPGPAWPGDPPVKKVEYAPISEKELPAVLAELKRERGISARTRELAGRFSVTRPTEYQRGTHTNAKGMAELWAKKACTQQAYSDARDADVIAQVSWGLDPLTASSDMTDRKLVVAALREWGTSENVPGLIKLLKADGFGADEVRIGAAHALAKIGDPRGLRPVAERLGDPWDQGHRNAIVPALCEFGNKAAVEEMMLEYVRGVDVHKAQQAKAACQVLGKVGSAKALRELEQVCAVGQPRPAVQNQKYFFIWRDAESAARAIRVRLGLKE